MSLIFFHKIANSWSCFILFAPGRIGEGQVNASKPKPCRQFASCPDPSLLNYFVDFSKFSWHLAFFIKETYVAFPIFFIRSSNLEILSKQYLFSYFFLSIPCYAVILHSCSCVAQIKVAVAKCSWECPLLCLLWTTIFSGDTESLSTVYIQ